MQHHHFQRPMLSVLPRNFEGLGFLGLRVSGLGFRGFGLGVSVPGICIVQVSKGFRVKGLALGV